MNKNREGYTDPTAAAAITNADKIDKSILVQLCSLKKERDDLKRRIERTEYEISRMNQEGYIVSDSVTCGKKGKKPLKTKIIQGFPYTEYSRRHRYKELYRNQLERTLDKIERDIYNAEQYIESIPDSRVRRIVRYKCLDDNLSWIAIANKMGGKHTADSCRATFERLIGMRK